MKRVMRVRRVMHLMILSAALFAAPCVVDARQQQPPPDFVSVEDAPLDEQIPAMPLLGAAYGFIWVGLLAYVWSLGKRLQKVEAELVDLESRKK